jgi:hypothetical protein
VAGESVRRQGVTKEAAAAMKRAGFEKARGEGIFTVRLDGDVLGWASHMANRSSDGTIEISPKVGVRHEALHRLVDRLSEREAGTEPTISTVLGYLMPEQSANVVWRFDSQTPVDAQAANLASSIVEYGRPYMLEHASLEALIEALRDDPWYGPKRISAALLLLGRTDEAREFVAAELEKLAERTDPRDLAATEFRTFAERFEAELTGRR